MPCYIIISLIFQPLCQPGSCLNVLLSAGTIEFSGGVGWSEAEAHAVRWNDWLAGLPLFELF